MTNPNKTSTKEAFQHEDRIQFSDGRIAFGFMTPGDRITFDGSHRYAGVNDSSKHGFSKNP